MVFTAQETVSERYVSKVLDELPFGGKNKKNTINITQLHSEYLSLQSQDTSTQLLSKGFLNEYNKTFLVTLREVLWQMHYEEELDLFWCIRANISIMLHKTIYEINITLLLRTHFKPPSSVCNNFLLRSHVEFGCLLLLKYAFYSLLYRCINEHFRCTHSSQENHIQTISYRNHVFIILYNL